MTDELIRQERRDLRFWGSNGLELKASVRHLDVIWKFGWTNQQNCCIITRLIFARQLFSGCSPVFHWTFGMHKSGLAGQLSEFLSRALSIRL